MEVLRRTSRYSYDPVSRRYRVKSSGRFASSKAIRSELDDFLVSIGQDMRNTSQQLIEGNITLAKWQIEQSDYIKQLHICSISLEKGGWATMDPQSYGVAGRFIRDEYEYLRNFTRQIASGEQRLDGTLLSRTQLYSESGRTSYHRQQKRSMIERGFVLAKRVLNPADHCQDDPSRGTLGCPTMAAWDWRSIEDVPPPGEGSSCLRNCRCDLRFKHPVTGQEWP